MIIVDASMLAFRCWSKMDFLKNSGGVSTGLEFGFLRTLQSLTKCYPDHEVVVVFDSYHRKKRIDPQYKANRKPWDDDFSKRFNALKRFLQATYRTAASLGSEADDVMWKITKLERGPHVVYTNDDDLLQAVDDERDVIVVKSFRSKLYEWDEAKVREKYGVSPRNLAFLRAFLGDKSDNLPGVGRVNRRLLAALIEWSMDKHEGDVMNALREVLSGDWSQQEQELLNAHVDSGQWGRNLALMWIAKTERVHVQYTWPGQDEDYVVEKLNEWEIRTLKICEAYKDRLAEIAADGEF